MLLTIEQLVELEDCWRALGHPVADRLAPGLDAATIDALTADLPFSLPDELRTWWGWHNGVVESEADRSIAWIPPLKVPFISLEWAVQIYGQMCRISQELHESVPDFYSQPSSWWPKDWFPWLDQDFTFAAVCAGDPSRPTQIRLFDAWVIDSHTVSQADSLGQVVSWWIQYMSAGSFKYDSDADESTFDRRPQARIAAAGRSNLMPYNLE